MAQLKPCPQSKINTAKSEAQRLGQKHFVLFDTLMKEHRVVSLQTYRGCNYGQDTRYETVAIAEW